MKGRMKFVVIGAIILLALLMTSLTKVRLNEVGVKINLLGSGVVERDFDPGYYLLMPFGQRMERLDPTVQSFMMGGGSARQSHRALEIRGKDQYTTKFDITLLYRIKKGEAWQVRRKVGADPETINTVVKSKAEKSLWDILGRLDTQDFYNVPLREKARTDAKAALSVALDEIHLELLDILIRNIEYDRTLEEILVEKQVLDQRKALNVESTKLEKELEKTQSVERKTEAMVRVIEEERAQEILNIEADTEAEVKRITSDADLTSQKVLAEADRHRRTQVAKGNQAKKEAEAKGDKSINEAYAADGGRMFITRQMVESLTFGEIEVNTNKVNPFDVEQILKMLGMEVLVDKKTTR